MKSRIKNLTIAAFAGIGVCCLAAAIGISNREKRNANAYQLPEITSVRETYGKGYTLRLTPEKSTVEGIPVIASVLLKKDGAELATAEGESTTEYVLTQTGEYQLVYYAYVNDVYYNRIYRFSVEEIPYFDFLSDLEQGHLIVVEVDHLFCVGHYRQRVGREEKLLVVLADADCERAALLGRYYLVGAVPVDHGYGVGPDYAAQRHDDRPLEVFAVLALHELDELHEHFGVGAALESEAFLGKKLFQACVVLDYPVVDQCQPPALRHVGVGVHGRRLAVRGPARVGNPGVP